MDILVQDFSGALPYLLRLAVAAVCGAGIGLERTLRQKEAGIRTHIIVALGSALMMVVSKYGFFDVVIFDSVSVDASRIAANIITGVSFLGSGIIIFKGTLKGLTTAAGVWATSGIGLAIGAGMYGIGIFATVLLLLIQIVIHRFLPIENYATSTITIKLKNDENALGEINRIFKDNGCGIVSSNIEKMDDMLLCSFTIKVKGSVTFDEIFKILNSSDSIISITH